MNFKNYFIGFIVLFFSGFAFAQSVPDAPQLTGVTNSAEGNAIVFSSTAAATKHNVYKNNDYYVTLETPSDEDKSFRWVDPEGITGDSYYLTAIVSDGDGQAFSTRSNELSAIANTENNETGNNDAGGNDTGNDDTANPLLALIQALKLGLSLQPNDRICIKSLTVTVNNGEQLPPLNFCFNLEEPVVQ